MYSFDVFDTLLTRTTATPKGIFALMQAELLANPEYQDIPVYIRENFYHLRTNAEMLARQYFRVGLTEEITLEQIYEAVAMSGLLTPANIQCLLTLERLTEVKNAIGIQENIDNVKALLSSNEQVVLISDMYLDKATIKSMLVKVDCIFENITLYVSSDYGKCKSSGNLFRTVQESEQVEYGSWIHIGDNIRVDIEPAKALGIQAEHYRYEELAPYEIRVLEKKENDVHAQLTIGAARNSRLMHRLSGPAAIGSSIGGIILFPYVWWLLQQSIGKGIRRLYFIARDGYLLKGIADSIIEKNNYDIQTYYIYGSRRAWRIAAINPRYKETIRIINGSYLNNVTSVNQLADVFQLSEEELTGILPVLNGMPAYYMRSPAIRDYILRQINEDMDHFIQFLSIKHEGKRQLIQAYLRQEIDCSDEHFAFVELAGSGITQGCLAELMHPIYDKPLQTFFFKLDCVKVPDNCIFYDYIPSYMYLHLIIEALARAPHGQTIGYREEQGAVVPTFSEEETKQLIDHGFNEYCNGVAKFTEGYLTIIRDSSIKADRIDLIIDYMAYIAKEPDQEVLEFIGGMPNNASGREKVMVEFAPVLSNKDLRAMYLTRTEETLETYYHGTALEYSILRSGSKAITKINYYQQQHDRLLGRIARLPKLLKSKLLYQDEGRIFPYGMLKGRIAIYAAGKAGRRVYKEMKRRKSCDIVQWVDARFESLSKEGLPVTSPDTVGSIPFDYIIIAVFSEKQANEIKELLIQKEIPKAKMVWMNLYL